MPCGQNSSTNNPTYPFTLAEMHDYRQIRGFCTSVLTPNSSVLYDVDKRSASLVLKKGYSVSLYSNNTQNQSGQPYKTFYAKYKDLWIPFTGTYNYSNGLPVRNAKRYTLKKGGSFMDEGGREIARIYPSENLKIGKFEGVKVRSYPFKLGKNKLNTPSIFKSIHLAYGYGITLYRTTSYTDSIGTYFNNLYRQGLIINTQDGVLVGSANVEVKPNLLRCQLMSVIKSGATPLCTAAYPDLANEKNKAHSTAIEFCGAGGNKINRIKKGGSYPLCSKWCEEYPEKCDPIKMKYCKSSDGKTSSWCKCINATEQDDYKEKVNDSDGIWAMSSPSCWYEPCNKPVDNDLQNGFFTQSIKTQVSSPACSAVINAAITKIDTRGATISGGIKLNTTQTIQKNDTAVNPSNDDPSNGNSTITEKIKKYLAPNMDKGVFSSVLYTSIVVIIIMILAIFGIILYDDDDDTYQPQFQQPQFQQPQFQQPQFQQPY
jgi:hypothetical protein